MSKPLFSTDLPRKRLVRAASGGFEIRLRVVTLVFVRIRRREYTTCSLWSTCPSSKSATPSNTFLGRITLSRRASRPWIGDSRHVVVRLVIERSRSSIAGLVVVFLADGIPRCLQFCFHDRRHDAGTQSLARTNRNPRLAISQ